MTLRIQEELELEDFVQRRIWAERNLSPGRVAWQRQGLVAVGGRATWVWQFANQEDLVLYQMTWL